MVRYRLIWLDLDLEDHTWDDGNRHAEVCHIHSQPPSHVLYLWKGNYQFKKNIVFVFSYLFCTCQLYFFRQTNQPRQLWWYCTRHKCSREHIGNLYLHILNIVSPEDHQTRSQPLTAKKRKLLKNAVRKVWFEIEQLLILITDGFIDKFWFCYLWFGKRKT